MDLQYGEQIVLASASPRRRHIFSNAGFQVTVEPASIDETITPGTPPDTAVKMLALRKATTVATDRPDHVVVGADTIVYLEAAILEKPADKAEACAMLTRLQGRWHTVYTGFAIVKESTGQQSVQAEETMVKFLPLTPEFISYYVDSGEPLDKAGAYGIQERGSLFVEQLRGCYFNVMGFPIAAFYREFRRLFGGEEQK